MAAYPIGIAIFYWYVNKKLKKRKKKKEEKEAAKMPKAPIIIPANAEEAAAAAAEAAKKQEEKEDAETIHSFMLLGFIMCAAGLSLGFLEFNGEISEVMRWFWMWKHLQLSGKVFVVLYLLIYPLLLMFLVEILDYPGSIIEKLWHFVGMLSSAVALFFLGYVLFWGAVAFVVMWIFTKLAPAAYGGNESSSVCAACGAPKHGTSICSCGGRINRV